MFGVRKYISLMIPFCPFPPHWKAHVSPTRSWKDLKFSAPRHYSNISYLQSCSIGTQHTTHQSPFTPRHLLVLCVETCFWCKKKVYALYAGHDCLSFVWCCSNFCNVRCKRNIPTDIMVYLFFFQILLNVINNLLFISYSVPIATSINITIGVLAR